jgi:hypothetical protein
MPKCSDKLGRQRKLKKIPYGAKRKLVWCDKCDRELVIPQPSKKRARRWREDEDA